MACVHLTSFSRARVSCGLSAHAQVYAGNVNSAFRRQRNALGPRAAIRLRSPNAAIMRDGTRDTAEYNSANAMGGSTNVLVLQEERAVRHPVRHRRRRTL